MVKCGGISDCGIIVLIDAAKFQREREHRKVVAESFRKKNTPKRKQITSFGCYTIEYADGKKYSGGVKKTESGELVRHGIGTITFPNGDSFKGKFFKNSLPIKEGKRDGLGIWTVRNRLGDIYTGPYKVGKKHGKGKIELPDRVRSKYHSIEGYFVDDRLKLSSVTVEYKKRAHEKTGRVYQGEFTFLSPNGKGKMTAANGSTYDGEWKDGKPHGQGTMIKPFQSYVGNFSNGEKDGLGKTTYCNGITHIGEWRKNKQHGYVCTYREGIEGSRVFHRWEKGRRKEIIREEDIPKCVRDFIDKSLKRK